MQLKNSTTSYGVVTKLLHWMVALLIVGLIWLGWYMVDLTYYDRWYNDSLSLHKAFGLLVLALGITKIAWIVYSHPPDFVASLKRWERLAARSTHHLFYLLMLLIPTTGYVISTSKGAGISMFGWFEVPPLFAVSESMRDLAIEVHFYAAYGAAAFVVLHAAAAIKHQVWDKDGTLRRMLW